MLCCGCAASDLRSALLRCPLLRCLPCTALRCAWLRLAGLSSIAATSALPTLPPGAGVEDRGLVFQAEGASTTLLDAIRNVFLRPVDGETKASAMSASCRPCRPTPHPHPPPLPAAAHACRGDGAGWAGRLAAA